MVEPHSVARRYCFNRTWFCDMRNGEANLSAKQNHVLIGGSDVLISGGRCVVHSQVEMLRIEH